jgi:Uma2 family endonuclease
MNVVDTPETSPIIPVSRKGDPTWEIAMLFPPQGEWSEEEYLALHANRMIELADGFIEVLPMPTLLHQFIVEYLFEAIKAYLAGKNQGRALFAPLPIRLGKDKYREPDVIFLKNHRLTNLRKQPEGADLVMEVVSEGEENRLRDLEIKRGEYAAAGIAEYWIVDPREGRITVLTLEGQTYREHGVFGPGTVATSVSLPGFEVAVDKVFAESCP